MLPIPYIPHFIASVESDSREELIQMSAQLTARCLDEITLHLLIAIDKSICQIKMFMCKFKNRFCSRCWNWIYKAPVGKVWDRRAWNVHMNRHYCTLKLNHILYKNIIIMIIRLLFNGKMCLGYDVFPNDGTKPNFTIFTELLCSS